jgi:hypothetical protein
MLHQRRRQTEALEVSTAISVHGTAFPFLRQSVCMAPNSRFYGNQCAWQRLLVSTAISLHGTAFRFHHCSWEYQISEESTASVLGSILMQQTSERPQDIMPISD